MVEPERRGGASKVRWYGLGLEKFQSACNSMGDLVGRDPDDPRERGRDEDQDFGGGRSS